MTASANHPFIEAMAEVIADSYRSGIEEVLVEIGYRLLESFTDEDVRDALERVASVFKGGTHCFYCHNLITPSEASREAVLAHAKVCPEHPCRALERELNTYRDLVRHMVDEAGWEWSAEGGWSGADGADLEMSGPSQNLLTTIVMNPNEET